VVWRRKLLQSIGAARLEARALALQTERLVACSTELVDACRRTRSKTSLTRALCAIRRIQEKSRQPG
jgi:hypothetical protein